MPALVDYIAFAQDPDLKKLIGNGKDISIFQSNGKDWQYFSYWKLTIVIDSSNSPLVRLQTLSFTQTISRRPIRGACRKWEHLRLPITQFTTFTAKRSKGASWSRILLQLLKQCLQAKINSNSLCTLSGLTTTDILQNGKCDRYYVPL